MEAMTEDGDATLLTSLNARVQEAKREILRATGSDLTWSCPTCCSPRHHARGIPWTPTDLREATGITGPVSMIAISELVKEGELVLDNHLRLVRS